MASDGNECVRFLDKEGREIRGLHIMTFGDYGVGKTSLMTRFTDDTFYVDAYLPCIGIDFKIRTVRLDDNYLKLFAWDCAGAERFRRYTSPSYLRMAHGALLAFDTTCMESFEHLKEWMDYFNTSYKAPGQPVPNRVYGTANDIPRIVVGTKSDLIDDRQVPSETAQEYASENGFSYIETSSKTGDNVEIAYITVAALVLDKFSSHGIERLAPGTVVKKPDQPKTYENTHYCSIS